MNLRRLAPWLLGAAVVAVYAVALDAPFVFDDVDGIVSNDHLASLTPLSRVVSSPAPGSSVGGRPVLALSLALNRAAGGLDPRGYRAVNVVIHAAAALVLMALVSRLWPSAPGWAPALAAAAWALHPLQTAAVTVVVQRGESLMGLCYLTVLYGVVRVAEGSQGWAWGATAVCAVGMGTKEVMVTAPVMALALDAAFLAGTLSEALRRRWHLHAALGACWGVLGLCILTGAQTGTKARRLPVDTALLTQLEVVAAYLRKIVWPAGLALDYGWPPAGSWADVMPEGLGVMALIALSAWGLRASPRLGFLGLWFFGTLGPSSLAGGLVDPAFDHRTYLALAAPCVLAVLLVARRPLWGAILVAAVLVLGGATLLRNRDYRTELSIWRDTVAKRPLNHRARNYLGAALRRHGDVPGAAAEFAESARLGPGYPHAHFNLGMCLVELGDPVGAERCLARAAALAPDRAVIHHNLGALRFQLRDLAGAEESLARAFALDPVDPRMRQSLDTVRRQRALPAPNGP